MNTLTHEFVCGIMEVSFTDEEMTVEIDDGRTVIVPLLWYPRLLNATPPERLNWRLIGNGEGIHWPDLDEDISLENILNGKKSGESPESMKKWINSRTKK